MADTDPPGRPPLLRPQDQFPKEALAATVQEFPDADMSAPGGFVFTWNIASAADSITPWGRNVLGRDRQLRDFWPTETYLAGAIASVSYRNATLDWDLRGPERVVQEVTDMMLSALAGDTFGWVAFIEKFSQDLFTQDNGAFIELIRDPGEDAASKFKDEAAPVVGIGHLDSNRCTRTGDPEYPVIYIDRKSERHKLAWYQVIPYSDYPSAIETMNGVGYCAVTRALRVAQIMRSIFIFKDEKISGRHFKQMHFISGVSRREIQDEMARGQEEANRSGLLRFIKPSILASLDPEKPISTATIDLAALPDGFDLDQEMKWYISGLSLAFGVDYQEFAPLPGGNIGSASQSMVLHRKASGKNPAVFMRVLSEGLRNYGAFPKNVTMRFNDKDEQEELEKQEVRTKALEEAAIAVRSGILSPDAVRKDLVRRGIYDDETIEGIAEEYGLDIVRPDRNLVGQIGGNTIREDAGRQDTGRPDQLSGDRLRKEAYPEFNITLPELKAPIVNVTLPQPPPAQVVVKEAKPATQVINVKVPKQPAPIVNVNVPRGKPQPAPVIHVHQQPQPAPVVNVSSPDVNVNVSPTPVTVQNEIKPAEVVIPPGPTEAVISVDPNGNKRLRVTR